MNGVPTTSLALAPPLPTTFVAALALATGGVKGEAAAAGVAWMAVAVGDSGNLVSVGEPSCGVADGVDPIDSVVVASESLLAPAPAGFPVLWNVSICSSISSDPV